MTPTCSKSRKAAAVASVSRPLNLNGGGITTVIEEDLCRCPVCAEVMLGRIYECPEGHGICVDKCYAALPPPRCCPQCRTTYGEQPTRGRIAEQIIASAEWPCPYDCGLRMCGAQLMHHLLECPQRPVRCTQCTHSFSLRLLSEHYKGMHKAVTAQRQSIAQCSQAELEVRAKLLGVTAGTGPQDLLEKVQDSTAWVHSDDTTWEVLDSARYGSIRSTICLLGTPEVILVAFRFSEGDRARVLVQVSHCVRERQCSVTIGARDGFPRAVLSLKSSPPEAFNVGLFTRCEEMSGLVLSYSSAVSMSPDGAHIPWSIDVL